MRCNLVSIYRDERRVNRNGKESEMSEKNQKAAHGASQATGCGCAKVGSGHDCPCKKRICLPILGLMGITVVVSLATKRRNRK